MSIETLVQHFGTVEDPRCCGKIEHRLLDILVIAVCAVIACAESWCDIALYGRSKLAWLQTFLELPNGIPSHDTFRRVFMLTDPDMFETGFTAWVGSLTAGFEREVVAIDGKTIRRSFDHGRDQSPLHVVSAWACEQRLVLGQRCVDGKSNEITAVPELLGQLALKNSIVTLDAMDCQTAIAEKILARGGDYRLTLKGNHALAHAAVVEPFDQHCFRVGAPSRADCDAFDDTHGRLVRRRVFASTEAATLGTLSGWPGLRTVLAVESIRSINSAPTKVGERDPLLPLELSRQSGHPGPGHPLAWGRGKCPALGAGCDVSRGRQPRARPHGCTQPGAAAQDRAQHRRSRPDIKGQRARPAEEGSLERQLHAPALGRIADELYAKSRQTLMRSPWGELPGAG